MSKAIEMTTAMLEAIVEAASRPNMRYVSPKTADQQDMQTLLRIRENCIQATKVSNKLVAYWESMEL